MPACRTGRQNLGDSPEGEALARHAFWREQRGTPGEAPLVFAESGASERREAERNSSADIQFALAFEDEILENPILMDIVDREIDRYIEGLFPSEDPVLREMEKLGAARNFPIVGPQVGRVLYLLTKLVQAKRIFEMGSGFGYSAYWFAKALPPQGKIYQTETSRENSELAKEFFEHGGLAKKSEFLVGDGTQLIDKAGGEFDIVFIDIHKENYPRAYRQAKSHLRKGGLLMADNLLWFGQVLEESEEPATLGIKEFTNLLFHDPDYFATLLPIRDGVGVGYRQ